MAEEASMSFLGVSNSEQRTPAHPIVWAQGPILKLADLMHRYMEVGVACMLDSPPKPFCTCEHCWRGGLLCARLLAQHEGRTVAAASISEELLGGYKG